MSSDGLTKATLQAAKVSRHVREPDRETLVRAKNDIGHLGRSFLNLFQRMAIKTELERVLGSRMAGELRIEDLVTPGAERGRPIDPFEKVGDPMPAVCHKHGLINVLRTGMHGLHGCGGSSCEVPLITETNFGHDVPRQAE